MSRPPPKVEALADGRGWIVDGELVPAADRSSTGRYVRDDEGRVIGPLRYSRPYSGVISVR